MKELHQLAGAEHVGRVQAGFAEGRTQFGTAKIICNSSVYSDLSDRADKLRELDEIKKGFFPRYRAGL